MKGTSLFKALSGHEDHPCLLVCRGKYFAGLVEYTRATANRSFPRITHISENISRKECEIQTPNRAVGQI